MAKTKIKQQYAENVIRSIDQNLLVIDNDLYVHVWNPNMELQFFSQNKAIGQNLKDLFPSFWDEYKGQIFGDTLSDQVIKNGKSREVLRFPLRTQDSQIRYFDIKGSPLRDKNRIIGATLIMNDVTQRIYLEKQLLRQARTTSLSDLGASIAHEIRNPLNSISLNIQLIKEWIDDPDDSAEEMAEICENVLSEIQRLNHIIRYFLEFSRPPAPQMLTEDPNLGVKQALRLLAEEARQADVEIILDLEDLPELPIDRNQLSQSIYNLCLNAIQAMRDQGGGKLEITSFVGGDYVLIEIKDNGPGIDNRVIDKLFDLFYTTKESGSGLGLPIANQIIEAHGGRIVAENNLDIGACFSIYLPVPKR